MRLNTLFLILVGAAALATIGWVFWRATEDTREWNELLSWAGKDLEKASKDQLERFTNLVNKRIPPDKDDHPPFKLLILPGPDASQRIIVCKTRGLIMIPSACDIRIDVMDEHRRVLSRTAASAGWRIVATGAKGPSRADLGPWTFEVESGQAINGADIARQIYALVGDQPVLIRLEDSAGKHRRNYFKAPNHTIGPKIPERTPEEWERSVSSSNPCEVLGALAWLGGRHAPPVPPPKNVYSESLEEAERVHNTRSRPGVQKRLKELSKSPHPWIAEAAAAALDPEE